MTVDSRYFFVKSFQLTFESFVAAYQSCGLLMEGGRQSHGLDETGVGRVESLWNEAHNWLATNN